MKCCHKNQHARTHTHCWEDNGKRTIASLQAIMGISTQLTGYLVQTGERTPRLQKRSQSEEGLEVSQFS